MLHGNVSRKVYGNALIGRYGGCFEEDITRLMMTECIMPRVWMHWQVGTNSRSENRAMHGSEEASKYEEVEVSTFNTYISPKNSCTYYR